MKDKILVAVVPLIKTYGIHFKMNDLARELGMSKSTLYQYFASKEILLEAVFDVVLKELRDEEAKIYYSSAPLEEKLKATMKFHSKRLEPFQNRIYATLYATPSIAQKMHQFNKERIQHLNKLLDEGTKKGIIRPMHRQVFIQLLQMAQIGFLNARTLDEVNTTYSDVIAHVFDIMLYGIIKSK
ncbi:MAG: TetR/AcrR family transcriptional regulator [Acidaminococcaceae bacterium]|nr:TetR/AcrR family transcriptional regulator [Acidaminococcaceae bacterium]MDD4721951.1 TetR/AcrR family transcriptional regulator [Acidaminococcaceae bacterium]